MEEEVVRSREVRPYHNLSTRAEEEVEGHQACAVPHTWTWRRDVQRNTIFPAKNPIQVMPWQSGIMCTLLKWSEASPR